MAILCQVIYVFTTIQGGDILFSNIYVITNVINNKKYVGQSVDVEKRWYSHKYTSKYETSIYLYNAMKKHGLDNFKIEIIESNIPLDKINEREKYWIRKLNTIRPNGYNLTLGGEGTKGYIMSDDTKALISSKAKERYASMSQEEKQEMIDRLPKTGGDLDKMNKGFKEWFENSPIEVEDRIKRSIETKKEKGYDFYNFSFGKMSEQEKENMYKTISKNNPRSKTIIMLDELDNIVMEFHSIGEASRYLHKEYSVTINSKTHIRKRLDTDKLAYGFKWKRK